MKHLVDWVRRGPSKYWYGQDPSVLELPPIVLNNEYIAAVNAAGTGVVNLIKANASDQVVLGGPLYPGTAGAINFSGVTPSTETSGSLITTGSTWVAHSAVGSCAAKLLCSYTGATGDYATLRIRARADAAGSGGNGVVAGNFSASCNLNNYPNLYAVQGYAQPSPVGTTVRTQSDASNIVCGVYSCVDRQATATSSGKDWSLWVDTHVGTKATASTYLARFSHNGTVAIDGLWTVYGGGRLPLLLNIEDATPGFVTTSGTAPSNFGARLAISINGTPMWVTAYTTSNA